MKVPQNAKKVFHGIIYDVYQWEQERFDGSHATHEMIGRKYTAVVIPTKGDKIFLSKQQQPGTDTYYSLLGGQIDKDEEPLQAAQRELLEEAGMESTNWKLLKTYEPMSKFDWVLYVYTAQSAEKTTEQKLDPGEKVEVIEVGFEEFISIVQAKGFVGREFALDIFRMEKEGKLEEFKTRLLQSTP